MFESRRTPSTDPLTMVNSVQMFLRTSIATENGLKVNSEGTDTTDNPFIHNKQIFYMINHQALDLTGSTTTMTQVAEDTFEFLEFYKHIQNMQK